MKDEEAHIDLQGQERAEYKGSPRSKLMEAILVLLHARPLRTSEIASNLGYDTKYVSSYLSYWRKKGLVYQEGGRWYLTPQGEGTAVSVLESFSNSRFKEMLVIAKQMLSGNVRDSINHKDEQRRKDSEKEVLSFIESKTRSNLNKSQKRDPTVCLNEITAKLTEEEKEILLFLLERYKQWGSTYVYLDQLQEEYKADMGWLFKVIRSLQTKRLMYLYNDPKLGFRVGFSQNLKRLLEKCE
ncbi:hypothetical protein MetMK1DRAFT_00028540 [Metallosphaera yellowstonensis MK1]|uniref:Replication initiator protein WhiP n=1 Tax=Metallosphaera yellowstonensis MK1 TaxID=671065 RepID=H2C8E5_9CREN|nr:hypothetical protein MetMK1DRAFT_00028540 [Metallosphaera yellowstonensis MK1]